MKVLLGSTAYTYEVEDGPITPGGVRVTHFKVDEYADGIAEVRVYGLRVTSTGAVDMRSSTIQQPTSEWDSQALAIHRSIHGVCPLCVDTTAADGEEGGPR